MRMIIAAGAVILLLSGVCSAQDSNTKSQQPPKAALPTRSLYRGGFQAPIYRGGFPRIMDGLRGNRPPERKNGEPIFHEDVDKLLPDAIQNQTPSAEHDDHDEHAHGGHTAACTGDCAKDPDHHHEAGEASKNAGDAALKAKRDELLAKINPAPAPVAEGEFDKAAFDRANRPGSGSGAYCVKCHTDKKNFIKKGSGDTRVSQPDRRLALADAFRKRNDTRLLMRPDVVPQPAATTKPMAKEIGGNTPETPDTVDPTMIGRAPVAAADELRAHLKDQPGDFHSMRLLAVALLASKHPQDAAETMAKAYESDPLLCQELLDFKAIGYDTSRINNLVKLAADAAKQSSTSKQWLLAAVLYQAQGSTSQALAALEKARHAGLNADVSDWLSAELKKKPERVAESAPRK